MIIREQSGSLEQKGQVNDVCFKMDLAFAILWQNVELRNGKKKSEKRD